jgi:chemosensory pili system protein ChpC
MSTSWRGWRLPLIAFARLAGIAEESGALGNKVLVLKALGGDAKLPYFALLTQGFPRLVTVAEHELVADDGDGAALPTGVQARVLLRDDPALLPDLAAVESRIGEALQAAA